jgi:hypothetical protein
MGLVAEFEMDCDALPLVTVAAAVPAATLTLELQYNHGERPLFLAIVTGGSQTGAETAFSDAYDVREWTLIGEAGDTRRYQAVPALSLEAQLGDHIDDLCEDGWRQTGWFADRDAFSMFSSFWQEHADFGLERLTRDGEPESPGDGLTDRQYEALRTAYELGYFDIPRRASLDDVAEELDITASSVSERLRRAQTQLIQETVATTWPPLPN